MWSWDPRRPKQTCSKDLNLSRHKKRGRKWGREGWSLLFPVGAHLQNHGSTLVFFDFYEFAVTSFSFERSQEISWSMPWERYKVGIMNWGSRLSKPNDLFPCVSWDLLPQHPWLLGRWNQRANSQVCASVRTPRKQMLRRLAMQVAYWGGTHLKNKWGKMRSQSWVNFRPDTESGHNLLIREPTYAQNPRTVI